MPPSHLPRSRSTGVWLKKFAKPGSDRSQPRPPVDPAHGIGVPGPQPAFVIVREKLGLVRRHVDIDRTIALAAFAGQAQIERFADRLALPAVGQHVAVEHLPQQPCAAARAVLLFARDHVARTHHLVAMIAALADAHAAQRRPRERPLVVADTGSESRTSGGL